MSVYREQSPKSPRKDPAAGQDTATSYTISYWTFNSQISKAVAFADDLILAIRNESVRAAENISNIEMNKISAWSRNNKINFNGDKSKVMIISRRKRKENK